MPKVKVTYGGKRSMATGKPRSDSPNEELVALKDKWKNESKASEDGDKENYPGHSSLVAYLKRLDPDLWSYFDFLSANRAIIINTALFNNKWNVIDSAWTRRFLREVQNLKPSSVDFVKKKVFSALSVPSDALKASCHFGNEELVHSKDIEHNLWDGAFLDTDFESKPHAILHEVSGGTEGCSASKLKSDLLKLAKGMKQHLQRPGRSANGTNINDARHIRVGGVRKLCILTSDVCIGARYLYHVGMELPRSVQQMVHLNKTIRSVYAMKEIWLETKRLLCKAQREASIITLTEDFLSGCSSPIKPNDGPWKALFHS